MLEVNPRLRIPLREFHFTYARSSGAVVSSSSNIAEGHGRRTRKEFVQFLSVALASLGEVDSLIALSERLRFLGPEKAIALGTLHAEASRLTYALMRKPGR